MLLTLTARRFPAMPAWRVPGFLLVSFAAAIVAAGAALVAPRVTSPHAAAESHPVWAGAIGAGVQTDAIVAPLRETSASYTSPVAIQAASAARTARPCGSEGACAPTARNLKTLVPPRRPASIEPSVAAVVTEPVPRVEPAKPKSVFTPSGLMDRLPSTNTLLRPFTTVGDKMSGLIKRF